MAVVVEEEQAHVALVGVAVDVDFVFQGVARLGQLALEGQLAAEQAIGPLALVQGVDPEPGDEQQVCLAAFDEHARRHPAMVQVPAVGAHVGGGPDDAAAHAVRLALDAEHPVAQEQGRFGHAHLDGVAVLSGEV